MASPWRRTASRLIVRDYGVLLVSPDKTPSHNLEPAFHAKSTRYVKLGLGDYLTVTVVEHGGIWKVTMSHGQTVVETNTSVTEAGARTMGKRWVVKKLAALRKTYAQAERNVCDDLIKRGWTVERMVL